MFATRSAIVVAVLALLALPAAGAQDDELVGNYTVKGTTADGKEYEGTLRITREGDCYRLRWKIGEGSQTGLGIRSGDVLSVSFTDGKEFNGVVSYRIREKGRLAGKWSAFGARGMLFTENLTRSE